MRTLYISYFGVREPLVNTQVLPYLRQLGEHGVEAHLLTFEPELRNWSAGERARLRRSLAADGIQWHCRAYHRRPSLPATVFDIMAGAWHARQLVRAHQIDVLHGRALVATVMGGLAKRLTGRKLIFDIRGLNCEEYVEAGVWHERGVKFSLAKAMERWAFRVADGFVVLTEKARAHLFPDFADQDRLGRPVEVIPCCVDWQRFAGTAGMSRAEAKAALGLAGRTVAIYVGALGGIYLTEELARFCAAARRGDPTTHFVFLTQSRPELIAEPLTRLGVAPAQWTVDRVVPEEVPRYLRAADYALSFRKPTYSQIAASPTKIAEYLASGLPVVCNAGIGDVDALVAGEGVGVVLRSLDDAAFADALGRIEALARDPETPRRCTDAARRHFDLETVGGLRYGRLYARLAAAVSRHTLEGAAP